MLLLDVQQVSLALGGPLLLDEVDFQLQRGERVCLLGRNGTGKTTFLKLLAGQIEPDKGSIYRRKGMRIAFLPQSVPSDLPGRVREVITSGAAKLLQKDHQVDRICTIFELDPGAAFNSLSAGMRRRVLLARELHSEPDVLLLDEPTNHMDISAISSMEEYLLRSSVTLFCVTHDRVLLQKLADRIIELDRGLIWDWHCGYAEFLQRKEAMLKAENESWRVFAKRLSREELWIRQGIKARRTRNEGRVKKLIKMREELRRRRLRPGNIKLAGPQEVRSSKLVLQAKGIAFSYADNLIFKDFGLVIERGDRVGIIGPNGSGKTTLLKVLLGEMPPAAGRLSHGPGLHIAYLDQMRDKLHEEKTVLENVGEGRSVIDFGAGEKHIYSYLQDFLFTPEEARTPVKVLSGGEKSRLLLACLFSRPFNLLVLDEPTNDLDIETLEMLEDMLLKYKGTLLLVSHDRSFLNNVVTSIVAIEDGGRIGEYVGGYDDWLRSQKKEVKKEKYHPAAGKKAKPRRTIRKRTFKENRELEVLPGKIEELDRELQELFKETLKPEFYKQSGVEIAAVRSRIKRLETELEQAYLRWEELESLPD